MADDHLATGADHHRFREALYLAEEIEGLEEHLAGCDECRALRDRLARTTSLLRRVHSQPLQVGPLIESIMHQWGWTQQDLADCWGGSQAGVSLLTSGHRTITPKVALRLEAAGLGPAENWLYLQTRWELEELRAGHVAELETIRQRAERRRTRGEQTSE
ncbi:MAG TPA: hypothetical protein VG476_02670 [Acidimicrobiales bacterium]|nr:hypothetical protein [Acidimicrobiales bacterium]